MPSISPQTNGLIGVDVTLISTVPQVPVGTEILDLLGTTYRYVKSSSAVAAFRLMFHDGQFIMGNGATTTALIGLTSARPLCVPQTAFTATNQFGWVAVKGPMTISALTLCAVNAQCYSTATAGAIDDTSGGSTMCRISGLASTSTVGGVTADTPCFAADYLCASPV